MEKAIWLSKSTLPRKSGSESSLGQSSAQVTPTKSIKGPGRRWVWVLVWGAICALLGFATSSIYFPQDTSLQTLTETRGGWRRKCAVMYQGPDCRDHVQELPTCIQGVYEGWWTVHQAVVPDNNTFLVPNLPSKTPGNGPGARARRAARMKKLSQTMSRSRAMEQVLMEALEAKKEVRSLNVGDQLRELLPETDVFGTSWGEAEAKRGVAFYRKCAVVSSAASLLDTEYGERINNHDLVVRFNNAPVTGYERHVGNFTSLRVTNSQYEGVREFTGEPVLGKWSGDMEGLERMVRKKIHPLNTEFRHYAQPMSFSLAGHMHTTGLLGVLILMHHCHQVSTFGFTGDRLEEWYYNKRPKGAIPKKEWLRTATWDAEDSAASSLQDSNVTTSANETSESSEDGTDSKDAGAGVGFPTLGRGRNLRRYDALTNGLAQQPVQPRSKKGKTLVIGAGTPGSVEEARAVVAAHRAAEEKRREVQAKLLTARESSRRRETTGTKWVLSNRVQDSSPSAPQKSSPRSSRGEERSSGASEGRSQRARRTGDERETRGNLRRDRRNNEEQGREHRRRAETRSPEPTHSRPRRTRPVPPKPAPMKEGINEGSQFEGTEPEVPKEGTRSFFERVMNESERTSPLLAQYITLDDMEGGVRLGDGDLSMDQSRGLATREDQSGKYAKTDENDPEIASGNAETVDPVKVNKLSEDLRVQVVAERVEEEDEMKKGERDTVHESTMLHESRDEHAYSTTKEDRLQTILAANSTFGNNADEQLEVPGSHSLRTLLSDESLRQETNTVIIVQKILKHMRRMQLILKFVHDQCVRFLDLTSSCSTFFYESMKFFSCQLCEDCSVCLEVLGKQYNQQDPVLNAHVPEVQKRASLLETSKLFGVKGVTHHNGQHGRRRLLHVVRLERDCMNELHDRGFIKLQ